MEKELFSPAESGPSDEQPAAAPAAEDSMEGVEETGAAPAATQAPSASTASTDAPVIDVEELEDADDSVKEMPPPPAPAPKKAKLTFVEHLKSPIVTLLVGSSPAETTLTAHQSLLTSSPFFADLCNSVPAGTHGYEIELPDDELDPMGCFLQFLYTGDYFPRIIPTTGGGESTLEEDEELEKSTTKDEDGRQLLKHAKVYTLAEKLGLPELKHLAHSKIHMINSTASGELLYAKYVYAHTPEDDTTIRGPIATFWAHRSYILRHEAEAEFKSMILSYPRFALDVITILLDQKERDKQKTHDSRAAEHSEGTPRTKLGRKRPRVSSVSV